MNGKKKKRYQNKKLNFNYYRFRSLKVERKVTKNSMILF